MRALNRSQPEAGGATAAPPDGDVVRTAARAFERDRYLAALLAPASVRGDLIALAAFAGELARIPAYVSEPMVGEIRLQWWRDTLEAGIAGDETTGDGGGHPIATAVIGAARRHGVPASPFIDVIDAQSQRLEDQPFATTDALLANTRAWDGGLFVIAALMLGTDSQTDDMLWESGAMYGLSRVLLDTPVDLTQGRCLLPADICVRHGATLGVALEPKVLAGFNSARRDVVAMVTPRANMVCRDFRIAARAQRIAALPLALVQSYLTVSLTADIAGAGPHDVGPLKRVWRLWLTHRLGRIVD